MTPSIAFVLCAGLGERLRPMTLATPKPLVPVWNRPLLAHTLDALAAWGVREVYLNTHWLAGQVRDFIADYDGPLALHELHEPEILGTGGCLRALAPHLGEEPFWLVNGDIVFDFDPAPLVEAFEASGRFAAAWLEPKRGPRTVETDYAGRITCWHSPTPGVEHTATFTGVSLLSPEVIRHLPEGKTVCSVVEAFENAMFANRFVRGVFLSEAYWNDAGTPEAYLQVHRDARKLPRLTRYAAHAEATPPPEVVRALELLGWKHDETIVVPLGARGSKRTFWRLVAPKGSALAIAYATEGREENAKYAQCARLLARAKLPVPKVLADEPNLLILEDLGDETLDKRAKALRRETEEVAHGHHHHGENCSCGHHDKECSCGHDGHDGACACGQALAPALRQVMETLAAFHRTDPGRLPLEPPFDAALYDWETGLYEQFAAPFPPEAKAELEQVKAALLAEPSVLVHRDFQSTNVLWHRNRPWLIDFQGMRRGCALYDLASFLYDPYVNWGNAVIDGCIRAYAQAAGADEAHVRRTLPYAGAQRLMQAIGAYHRLASVGQPRFLKFVSVARARAAALAEAVCLTALAAALRAGD